MDLLHVVKQLNIHYFTNIIHGTSKTHTGRSLVRLGQFLCKILRLKLNVTQEVGKRYLLSNFLYVWHMYFPSRMKCLPQTVVPRQARPLQGLDPFHLILEVYSISVKFMTKKLSKKINLLSFLKKKTKTNSCATAVEFILVLMPITRPYSLWNLRNHTWNQTELRVKQMCLPSNIPNNNKNELWKTVGLTSVQKPQLQSVSIFFKFQSINQYTLF